MKFSNRKLAGFAAVAVLLLCRATEPNADALGPVVSLAEQDRQPIEEILGKDVIGEALATPTIENPGAYLKLAPRSLAYRILSGPNRGKEEIFHVVPKRQANGGVIWHYGLPGGEVGLLAAQPGGDLELTGVEDSPEGVVAKYSPPEPFLLKGMAAGDTKRIRMEVRVFDLNRPNQLLHEGSLDVAYQYLGAFRIKAPAGTFDTVLIKSTFGGEIGPARFDEIQYRFFAADVGMVATVEQRDVSAFVVYRPHLDHGVILADKPH